MVAWFGPIDDEDRDTCRLSRSIEDRVLICFGERRFLRPGGKVPEIVYLRYFFLVAAWNDEMTHEPWCFD